MDILQQNVEIEDLDDDQMGKIIKFFQERLKESREERNKDKQPLDVESCRRKRMLRAQDKVLNLMLYMMDKCKAQGFFYGIVDEKGEVVTASSDALRDWLHEKVCFEREGLPEIEKFNADSDTGNNVINIDNVGEPKSLMEINDNTLGSLISTLMRHCTPPQKKFRLKQGVAPPWWPTATEEWWVESGFPINGDPPPYKKPHDLRKAYKAGLLTGVVKHLIPNTALRINLVVRGSKRLQHKMTARENRVWMEFVKKEEELYLQAIGDSDQHTDTEEVIGNGNSEDVFMIDQNADENESGVNNTEHEPAVIGNDQWMVFGNGDFSSAFNNMYRASNVLQVFNQQQPMMNLRFNQDPPTFSVPNVLPGPGNNLVSYVMNNSILHPQLDSVGQTAAHNVFSYGVNNSVLRSQPQSVGPTTTLVAEPANQTRPHLLNRGLASQNSVDSVVLTTMDDEPAANQTRPHFLNCEFATQNLVNNSVLCPHPNSVVRTTMVTEPTNQTRSANSVVPTTMVTEPANETRPHLHNGGFATPSPLCIEDFGFFFEKECGDIS